MDPEWNNHIEALIWNIIRDCQTQKYKDRSHFDDQRFEHAVEMFKRGKDRIVSEILAVPPEQLQSAVRQVVKVFMILCLEMDIEGKQRLRGAD